MLADIRLLVEKPTTNYSDPLILSILHPFKIIFLIIFSNNIKINFEKYATLNDLNIKNVSVLKKFR